MLSIIFSIVKAKWFPWAVIVAVFMGGFQINSCNMSKANERLETYKRQVSGQLTEKERELQAANHEIGALKSQLLSQEDLTKYWKKEKEETDGDFDKFVKEHNLRIKSMDKTIASLKQQIKGGNTTVIVEDDGGETCKGIEECVVKYSWEDDYKRFKLEDPNIFEKNNETFESDQVFKVYGEIYEQKDGSLQTKRLVLREVRKNTAGDYEDVPGGKADIVESEFKYSNPPELDLEWSWTDLFRMRAIAVAGVTAFPDSGATKLGLGLEFFSWEGLGINTHVAFDFQDVEKIEHKFGIAYNPTLFDTELNLGIGVSYGTPYAKFFQEHSFGIDLIFYLNN